MSHQRGGTYIGDFPELVLRPSTHPRRMSVRSVIRRTILTRQPEHQIQEFVFGQQFVHVAGHEGYR